MRSCQGAAGNVVVLNPSEMAPFSIMRLAVLAVEAGVPAGILIIERLVQLIARSDAGATWSADTNYSPINFGKQRATIDSFVTRATQAGAELLARGELRNESEGGPYYAPTIPDNAKSDMEAVREEIFGPVVTVQRPDEEEGIALANDTRYGLAAGVCTSDINRGLRAMRVIQAGTMWINRCGRTADFIIPTGGYKQSGIGKDLGRYAYERNLRYKSALIAIH